MKTSSGIIMLLIFKYKNMFEGMPSIEKPKITYEELKAKVRAAQDSGTRIKNMADYNYFMRSVYSESIAKDPSNPIELPEHPDVELGDWVSEGDFLGTDDKVNEGVDESMSY